MPKLLAHTSVLKTSRLVIVPPILSLCRHLSPRQWRRPLL